MRFDSQVLDSWLPVISCIRSKNFWVSCVLDTTIGPESLYAGNIVTRSVTYWSSIDTVLVIFR